MSWADSSSSGGLRLAAASAAASIKCGEILRRDGSSKESRILGREFTRIAQPRNEKRTAELTSEIVQYGDQWAESFCHFREMREKFPRS